MVALADRFAISDARRLCRAGRAARTGLLLAAALAAADAAAARPTEAVVPPPVRHVTLYRDRAVVRRAGSYRLARGTNVLRFEPFSPNIKEVSLRAGIGGASGARIGGVSSWIDRRPEIQDDDVRQADAKIRDTRRAIEEEASVRAALEAERRYLAAYEESLRVAISEQTLGPSAETDRWQAALDALNRRREATELHLAQAGRAIDTANTALTDAVAALRALENPEPRAVRIVEVQVESELEQQVELSILYEMARAGWDPIYEVSEDEQGRVRLACHAGLQQNTEEDWTDVAVTLSTAEPAMGGERPKLGWLRVRASRPVEGRSSRAVAEVIDTTRERPADVAMVETGSAAMELEIRQEATSFAIELPEAVTILRDGRLTKVGIARAELTGETEYWTVPEVRRHVYRRLKTANPLPIPLLPGDVQVYHRGSYVGSTRLGFVPVSGAFTLSTGTDPELTVTTSVGSDSDNSATRTDCTYTKGFTVANGKKGDVRIRVAYSIPVSEVEEARVTFYPDRADPPPTEYDRQKGHLFWDVEVPAGGSERRTFVYRLDAPRELLRQVQPVRDEGLLRVILK